MTTALSTSRPKLEIDGRPISRLLSGLTPSAHPLSHFSLPLLRPPPNWKASSSFIAGETRLFWAGTGGGTRRSRPQPDRVMVGSLLQLTQTEVPTCWFPHQTGICSATGVCGKKNLKMRPAVKRRTKDISQKDAEV